MSYSTSAPPILLLSSPLAARGRVWWYENTDAETTVRVTGYITNGGNLGMRAGDLVIYFKTDGPNHYMFNVVTVSSTLPGAVDLSNSTALTSATNSD